MNEFEKYEAKQGRRLAYRIIFYTLLTIAGIVTGIQDISQGEGPFWLFFTFFAAGLYYVTTRWSLREYFSIHKRPDTVD